MSSPFTRGHGKGRQLHELMTTYQVQISGNLSVNLKISDSIHVSSFEGLSLSEYLQARAAHCRLAHSDCSECPQMISVGEKILECGLLTLKDAFTYGFGTVDYTAFKARRRLLQMPLACLRIACDPTSKSTECYVIEHSPALITTASFHLSKISYKNTAEVAMVN